jgi:hypothetical protein
MRASVLVEFQTGKQSIEILCQEECDVLGFRFHEVSEISQTDSTFHTIFANDKRIWTLQNYPISIPTVFSKR